MAGRFGVLSATTPWTSVATRRRIQGSPGSGPAKAVPSFVPRWALRARIRPKIGAGSAGEFQHAGSRACRWDRLGIRKIGHLASIAAGRTNASPPPNLSPGAVSQRNHAGPCSGFRTALRLSDTSNPGTEPPHAHYLDTAPRPSTSMKRKSGRASSTTPPDMSGPRPTKQRPNRSASVMSYP